MRIFFVCLVYLFANNFSNAQGLYLNGSVRMVTTPSSYIVVDGVDGNVTLGTSSNFRPTAIDNSGEIHLDGNWVNNSGNVGFVQEGNLVRLTGANQTIGGTSSTSFYKLHLEGTGTKQLLVHTRVGGVVSTHVGWLSVGDRVLNLNNFQLFITNNANSAITTGSGYIQSETNAGYNKGLIRWKNITANNTYTFPFGVNGVKIPLIFTKTSGSGDVAISTRATNAANNLPWANVPATGEAVAHMASAALSLADASVPAVIDRWWDISTNSNVQANVTFNYRLIENTTNYSASEFGAQHWRSNAWQAPEGAGNVNPDGVTGYVTANGLTSFTPINTTQALEENQTYFSPYVLAPIVFPLPTTMDYLRGNCEDSYNQIEWRAAKGPNTDYYVLQKSNDGYEWTELDQIVAQGDVDQMIDYNYQDISTRRGQSYYRLLEVNYSGTQKHLGLVDLACSQKDNTLTIYPNPSAGNFVVEISSVSNFGERELYLTDLNGKLIDSKSIHLVDGTTQFHFNGNYATGMYLLYIKGQTKEFDIQKIIIKN